MKALSGKRNGTMKYGKRDLKGGRKENFRGTSKRELWNLLRRLMATPSFHFI